MIRPLLLSLALCIGSHAAERPNLVLVLSDDHRYDLMGFHPEAPEWLETPTLDKLAAGGAHLANAFVSTSLCSPSRASILTGQFMHHHRVVDNQRAVPEGTVFFPEHLQKAGYHTAFIGKWHMGHDDDTPRPGFDHWVSFVGQGEYTMGDNGFALGEHGFYDKRDAFEESIRVPMLAHAPGRIEAGSTVTQMVQNIDVAATLLDFAGVAVPEGAPEMDGRSFAPLQRGEEVAESGGLVMPLRPPKGVQFYDRKLRR